MKVTIDIPTPFNIHCTQIDYNTVEVHNASARYASITVDIAGTDDVNGNKLEANIELLECQLESLLAYIRKQREAETIKAI